MAQGLQFGLVTPPPPLPAIQQRVADAHGTGHISSSERVALDGMWSRDQRFSEQLQEGGLSRSESLLVAARRVRYEATVGAFTLLPVPIAHSDERAATRTATYDAALLSADRASLLDGVREQTIDQSEFGTLDQFARETQVTRAEMRPGGFSSEERTALDGRMARYDEMTAAFSSTDAPRTEWTEQTSGWETGLELDREHQSTYGEAALDREGPIYTEERAGVRASIGRPRSGEAEFTPPQPERMEQLQELFPRLDGDGNGQLTRAELHAAVRDPDLRGDDGRIAAASLGRFEQLAQTPGEVAFISAEQLTDPGEGSPDRPAFLMQSSELADAYARTEGKLEGSTSLYGEGGRPDPSSIQQGFEGDCWYLAPLSTLQPEQIERMITAREDGQFEVRFPGHPEPVVVGPPTDGERSFLASGNGIWVNVMETAARQVMEGRGQDMNGDWPGHAMELFSGVTPGHVDMLGGRTAYGGVDGRDSATVGTILERAFADGRSVVASADNIPAEMQNSPLPIGDHVWGVTGYDSESGTVTVRNPWGRRDTADGDGRDDGTFTMPLQEFQATFSYLTVERAYTDQPIL